MSENQKPTATKEVTEPVVMDDAQIETKADETGGAR